MTTETYRIEFETELQANVHGGGSKYVKATLYAITKLSHGGHQGNAYRFIEDASAPVHGGRGGYAKAQAQAVRMLRHHAMLKRDYRRETQAAFMVAVAS